MNRIGMNQYSKTLDLHMSSGVICKVSENWWKRFLFKQAMDLHDTRPLKTSRKVSFRSEYLAFCNAKLRCTQPGSTRFENYGGRGIKFLFSSFDQFIEEIGPRPSGYLLDRIHNDGNYEPGNVRWATASESSVNSRKDKPHKPHKPGAGRPKGSKTRKVLTAGVVEGLPSLPRGTGSHGTVEQEGRQDQRLDANEVRSGLVG